MSEMILGEDPEFMIDQIIGASEPGVLTVEDIEATLRVMKIREPERFGALADILIKRDQIAAEGERI